MNFPQLTFPCILYMLASSYHPEGNKEMSSILADHWPIAPSFMSPMRGGGLQGLSQWLQLRTWSPNKLWRFNAIFNLCCHPTKEFPGLRMKKLKWRCRGSESCMAYYPKCSVTCFVQECTVMWCSALWCRRFKIHRYVAAPLTAVGLLGTAGDLQQQQRCQNRDSSNSRNSREVDSRQKNYSKRKADSSTRYKSN